MTANPAWTRAALHGRNASVRAEPFPNGFASRSYPPLFGSMNHNPTGEPT